MNAIIAAVVMGGLAVMCALVLRNVTVGEESEPEPHDEHERNQVVAGSA